MNEEQLAAILHTTGPARLLAFAGSGKTRVLSHRIAKLVLDGVDPSRILALTFSKKAADEMNERVKALDVDGVRAGTWHSLCLQILREDITEWHDWDIPKSEGQSRTPLKEVLGYKHMNWLGADTNKIYAFIGWCKAHFWFPNSPEAEELARKRFAAEASKALRAFHLYNELIAEKRILTFDDMLVHACEHLDNEKSRTEWASKYDYILQDEAQDESPVQHYIAEKLARDHRNYMVIGDCFQAIYGFRGSSPKSLATFDREWQDAKTFPLPRNYRSCASIIMAANGIVQRAKLEGLEPRPMIGERRELGEVRALASENPEDEASNFVSWIQKKVKTGEARYDDFCCLVRVNAQSRAIEEELLDHKIPYVVIGGISFYERKEVRDLLAYLRIACGRGELEDVKRCINAPFRYLGAKYVDRIIAVHEREESHDWPAIVLSVADQDRIQARQKESAIEWADLMRGLAHDIEEDIPPADILQDLVTATRYLEFLKKEDGTQTTENNTIDNVREMIRVAKSFHTTAELLEYVDETIRASQRQRRDKQAGGQRVVIMTVHKSKGLEWPHVWIAGFNDTVFPHPKGDIEEERRLAYVAATRARDSLVMSYCRSFSLAAGMGESHPSPFIQDAGIRFDGPSEVETPVVTSEPFDVEEFETLE